MESVAAVAEKYNSIEEVKKELRNVQSKKCRLRKKALTEKRYAIQLGKVLQDEELLKRVVDYLQPKKVFVTEMDKYDIEKLSYDETVKAIKSIQSKICRTDYTMCPEEYNKALNIEDMLQGHKKAVKPCGSDSVKKCDLQKVCNQIKSMDTVKVDKDRIVGMLESLLKGSIEE